MKLTPLDIRHKEFKRGMRGYADVEVDEFLDEIADEYERLFKENIDLQERVESLEDKVAGYKRIEDTLQKTLINAQASAEELKQNATKESQLILQGAELKGRQLVNEAYSERQAIEQSMAKLRNAEEDFRFKFKTLLEGFLRQLQGTPEVAVAAPEPATDFTRHAEAIKEAIARESAAAPTTREEPAAPTTREEPAAPATREEPAAPATREEPAETAPAPARPTPYVATADEAPRIAPERAPDAPAVTPALGRGGVQAGVPPRREAPADGSEAGETTMERRADEADGQETTASGAPGREDDAGSGESGERDASAERDDLLADVDTGVNENEFKW